VVAADCGMLVRYRASLDPEKRKREELLAEVVPHMEGRGYDTGAVKAVMGR
jgi:hypothetical protein